MDRKRLVLACVKLFSGNIKIILLILTEFVISSLDTSRPVLTERTKTENFNQAPKEIQKEEFYSNKIGLRVS